MRIRLLAILLITSLSIAWASDVPEDRGAMGLAQALNRLDNVDSVLHTGAHPDDENSALLAWLSRGQGVRTGYLAANRGDGGQNLLGKELFEALGVIRTEELLGARRMDHAQQFFTPTFDFGFSKTAEETFDKWGHEKVVGDFVRVIRQFRPEIIISAFSGTPADGHGNHQVAGIVTQEAFKAAADPKQFPEYGKPWQAKKLYMSGMRGGGGPGANGANAAAGAAAANRVAAPAAQQNISINVGEYDYALGRSYAEIAAEGRSLHRSQAQGAARNKGPQNTMLRLVAKTVPVSDTDDLFAGTVHRLPDLAQLEPALGADLNQLEQRVQAIRDRTRVAKPAEIVPDLVEALKLLRQIESKATNEQVLFLLHLKDPDFNEAARLAAGLVVDVIASDDTLVPGQEFTLTASVINGGPYNFPAPKFSNDLPRGWTAVAQPATGSLQAGQRFNQVYKVTVASDAPYTQPYWLQQPRDGDRFVWPAGSPANMPFDPPLVQVHADADFQGTPIAMMQPAEYRRVDPMLGESRADLNVLPALSVRISPDIAVVPLVGNRKKEFTVTIENQNPAAVTSEVRLVTPQGWTATPATQTVKLTRQGEKASVQFMVDVPNTAGHFSVKAVAQFGGQEYKSGYQTLAYPHIQTHYIYSPAESKVEVFDVKSLVTTVGYVEGAGDSVAEALKQIGVNVTFLNASDLATGDLSKYQTIVLGIRAYAVRDDLKAYNSRLLEYVHNGGNLIVQYNTPNVMDSQLTPYPLTISPGNTDRVTDENAPVKILDPASPVFNVPNKITDKDFEGWVQERGLNFVGKWDPNYKPLLSSKDPGEDWRDGGMLLAKYGKGTYTYTGYDFFRELPAGVEGAFRLFLNLISIEN